MNVYSDIFEVMPVLNIHKMEDADKKLAHELLDGLNQIRANDVGYMWNMRDYYYENEGQLVFNEQDYDISYKLLADICHKYLPEQYHFKPFIFYVWW